MTDKCTRISPSLANLSYIRRSKHHIEFKKSDIAGNHIGRALCRAMIRVMCPRIAYQPMKYHPNLRLWILPVHYRQSYLLAAVTFESYWVCYLDVRTNYWRNK